MSLDAQGCIESRDQYFACMSKATDKAQCDGAFALFEKKCPAEWRQFFYQQQGRDLVRHVKTTELIGARGHVHEGLDFINATMYK